MFAPKTKFPSFGAALLFPSTIITNYCFSAILKGLKLSSSSSAVNTSQFGQLSVVLLSCLPRKQSFRVLAPLYPFQVQLLQTIAFLHFKKKCLNQAVRLQQSIPHSLTTASRSVVMFASKTKFLIFSAALPFPNTIITNYCFSAVLKGLKLSSSSTAINL